MHGTAEDAIDVKHLKDEEEQERWEEYKEKYAADDEEKNQTQVAHIWIRAVDVLESVFMKDWKLAYTKSPKWQKMWTACHTAGAVWPQDVQLRGADKQYMYYLGKLCVPESLQVELVHQWHSQVLGHCGVEKALEDMSSKFLCVDLL